VNLSVARKYRKSHRFVRNMLSDNPALVLGIDLPFIIVCATTLKNAVALSVMMLCVHVITMLIARLVTIKLPLWVRSIINVTVTTVTMLLARELVMLMFPNIMNLAGMYLYLMAVNGLTLAQANARRGPLRAGATLARAFTDVLTFAILMVLIAAIREYFGNGTLWSMPVPVMFRQTGMLYPFFGFIMTAFLLAFLRRANKLIVAAGVREAERSEAAHKHIKIKPELYDNR